MHFSQPICVCAILMPSIFFALCSASASQKPFWNECQCKRNRAAARPCAIRILARHTYIHTNTQDTVSHSPPLTSSHPAPPPSIHKPFPFISARTGAYYKITYLRTLWGKLDYDASKTVATIEEDFREIAESIAFQDQVRNLSSCNLPFTPKTDG